MVGRRVKLVHAAGLMAHEGSVGVIVDGSEYEREYEDLSSLIGGEIKHFLAIRWVDEPTCMQPNGFYHASRFVYE